MTVKEIERLTRVEEKVRFIEDAVSNHIPSALNNLDIKVQKINLRLAYASGALFVLLTLVQIALNKWG